MLYINSHELGITNPIATLITDKISAQMIPSSKNPFASVHPHSSLVRNCLLSLLTRTYPINIEKRSVTYTAGWRKKRPIPLTNSINTSCTIRIPSLTTILPIIVTNVEGFAYRIFVYTLLFDIVK